jgi:Zinc-finger associated domain (zf-AD)
MLKYKLCRICMKQKNTNTSFVKIFESTAFGDLVANILIDFANVNVAPNDELPHIICNLCLDYLLKCREFQKLVIQNDSTLAKLAEKTPDEIERTLTQPLIRIEKVKDEPPTIVQLEVTEDLDPAVVPADSKDVYEISSESSSSEDEDDFPIEEEVIENQVEAEPPRFLCCCCPVQFTEEHDMVKHLKTEHFKIRSKLNIAPVDKDPDEVKQCEMCFKYCVGIEKLMEHQLQFRNSKQCVECGGFYMRKG